MILHDSMTGCVATCTHGLDYIKLVFSCLITFNSELELGIYNIKLVVWFHRRIVIDNAVSVRHTLDDREDNP